MELTHLDANGSAVMVDVGHKPVTRRTAVATATVLLGPAVLTLVRNGELPKGDVLTVARLAGIQAAKRTFELIPLCHPLFLSSADVRMTIDDDHHAVVITATAATVGQTGVEMEALTAASVAALTIYDMCKAADKSITITGIRLVQKTGGKSGDYHAK
ncbi:MAG: cyclic pyranopterin monophosphate synthase MoaC [Bacteroidetes bacterium]|nr:cyclic pyranopterin monophosphate synthase MoaC [Bacteroidota bacterium]